MKSEKRGGLKPSAFLLHGAKCDRLKFYGGFPVRCLGGLMKSLSYVSEKIEILRGQLKTNGTNCTK